MFEFEYPLAFLLLFLFIIGQIFFKSREDALILPEIFDKKIDGKNYFFILKWLGIISLIIALASPISKEEFFPEKKPAYGIMLCLDLSVSMSYRLGNQRRIDVVKSLASDFAKKRANDHVGLVGFAGFAYVASPLTYDVEAVSKIISRIGLGNRTALRDGVFIATRMLKKSPAKEKIIVLLTDGEDTASQTSLATLKSLIKKEKVKIYAIGVGHGSSYDAALLEDLARISGGEFHHASSADALKNIYKRIDELEKSDFEQEKFEQKFYYFQYPLFFALMMFILFLYLKRRSG